LDIVLIEHSVVSPRSGSRSQFWTPNCTYLYKYVIVVRKCN